MRIFIDGKEYQGTPEEIHTFFVLSEPVEKENFEPLYDLVQESKATIPDFLNPSSGVQPGPDDDTGVDFG